MASTLDPSELSAGSERQQEESAAYFSELLSYSLERLGKEPELLRADQEALRRQLQDTAVGRYRSFIDAARCLDDLRAQLGAAGRHLDALAADLPKLQAACDAFRGDAARVAAARAANRQLYAAHPAVLEVLEVPQLMDTCCRSGNYDEALDLRAFVNKVAVMHGDLGVVQRLVAEVEAVSADMLEQLLGRLAGPVQLPECLRVIGYLRRLAAFPEPRLRAAFLQRREAWVAGLAAELDEANPYEFLKRLTDVYRLHLFDVVMQYRAIFADDPAAADQGGILYAWAQRRIAAYLDAMRTHLPRVGEGGSLASVLDHAMYCGASLGRVGLDFRPLLAPLFEGAVLRLYSQSLAAATDSFRGLLEAHKWAPASSSLAARARQASSGDAAAAAAAAGEGGGGEAAAGSGSAAAAVLPASLVEHVPLAVYTNGLLSAFNELRHCAPLSLRAPCAAALQDSLAGVAGALAHHGLTRALGEAEQQGFDAACKALTGTLCPYATACFDRIYAGGGALVCAKAVAQPLLDMVAQRAE